MENNKPDLTAINAKIAAEKEVAEKEAAASLPKEMPKSKATVVVAMRYCFTPVYHPYQRRWVPEVGDCPEGVEMVLDSWLQSQIDAGLVKVVK